MVSRPSALAQGRPGAAAAAAADSEADQPEPALGGPILCPAPRSLSLRPADYILDTL